MKVLIVDDETSIVDLIRMNLKLEGYETVSAFSGRDAVRLYHETKPDIVLLDIMLPDMDGYDVLRAIQEANHTAGVIFITANDKRTSKILGLELGADDYITKPFDNKELVVRVKTLWRRISMIAGSESAGRSKEKYVVCGDLQVNRDAREVLCKGNPVTLTYREFDVLCYFLTNPSRVVKRDELLENVWGYSFMGNTRAVDIAIKRLRSKIGECGNYIKTSYGVGYKFEID